VSRPRGARPGHSRTRHPHEDSTAGAPVAAPAAPLELRHPALIVTALVATIGLMLSASFHIIDTDFWQHLAVGKAIWQLHAVPRTHLWSYPNYGSPEVLPSWGFRALVWPFWSAGGVAGLFVWRWWTTLAVFGLAWAAARRMGARGLTPLVWIVVCSLVYRQRSQVRPETLASVLLALEIWILETRRSAAARGAADPAPGAAGADPTPWLIAVAWVWANTHISYFLGFIPVAAHLLDDLRAGRTGAARRLAAVTAAALAASCLNPFGARALWQPFDYLLRLRHEPLYRGIGELQPVSWAANRGDATFVLLAGWPVLLVWRARRFGLDRVEALLCAFFTAYASSSQRFLGTHAVLAASYAARDLDAWVRTRRWPAWSARPAARAALAVVAIVAAGLHEWSRADRPLGISIDMKRFPVAACDFMAAHGVAGRGFAQTRVGGYQLWRFWPDRSRLPFMDIHQTGSPEDRRAYAAVFSSRAGWVQMTRRHTFDYVLLDRYQYPGDSLTDVLDADSTWSLVFLDDAGVLYVRREGPLHAIADSLRYHVLGAGPNRMTALAAAWDADSALRARCRAELEREAAGSAFDAAAERGLGLVAFAERRLGDARAHLRRALAVDPRAPRTHEALGMVELWDQQPMLALIEFERERALSGPGPGLELRMGLACQGAGDAAGARRHFERELEMDPGNARVRSLIEALQTPGR
jgi:hypothetical protein